MEGKHHLKNCPKFIKYKYLEKHKSFMAKSISDIINKLNYTLLLLIIVFIFVIFTFGLEVENKITKKQLTTTTILEPPENLKNLLIGLDKDADNFCRFKGYDRGWFEVWHYDNFVGFKCSKDQNGGSLINGFDIEEYYKYLKRRVS